MRLHFIAQGSGPPLLILHGLFGAADNWQTVARRLRTRFEVFSLDQRNHGRSPHDPVMSYKAMAGDVVDFLQEHGLANADVLGHSMGGKAAMQLALDHPDLVRKLIVVDIAPRPYSARHREIIDALLSLDLASFSTRHQMEAALAPSIPDPAVRRFLLKSVSRTGEGKFQWKLNLPALSDNYDALSEGVSGPTPFVGPVLFLAGENSPYIREPDWVLIRELFPKAVGQVIAGAGHWVQADAPDAVVSAVEHFLR